MVSAFCSSLTKLCMYCMCRLCPLASSYQPNNVMSSLTNRGSIVGHWRFVGGHYKKVNQTSNSRFGTVAQVWFSFLIVFKSSGCIVPHYKPPFFPGINTDWSFTQGHFFDLPGRLILHHQNGCVVVEINVKAKPEKQEVSCLSDLLCADLINVAVSSFLQSLVLL